jgi:hypothetical protein
MNLTAPMLSLHTLRSEELDVIRGGMFGPFVNSPAYRPPTAPAPAPVNPVTLRSVAGAVVEGATAGYLGAAAAGVPPQGRAPISAAAGLANGLAHGAGGLAQSMPSPGQNPFPANLNVAAHSRFPSAPRHQM